MSATSVTTGVQESATQEVATRKGLALTTLAKGTKDFLDFLDATKEAFFAYLYHRTGSMQLASVLLTESYVDLLSRSMALWWFKPLTITLLIDTAERGLADKEVKDSDLEKQYLQSISGLTVDEKKSMSTLHDALWSLPNTPRSLCILSLLIGLSLEQIANLTKRDVALIKQDLLVAKDLLMTRWQPIPSLVQKLDSVSFIPTLDLSAEKDLRFKVVEKYNALKFRRYQWVIIGGLFAVMSNVIVASVLAFAVVTLPPTTVKGVTKRVASLDAVLLQRELQVDAARQSIAVSLMEAQRIAAYDRARDLTSLGLASALESLKTQRENDVKAERLKKLLERASTALGPLPSRMMRIAMAFWR